MGDQDISVPKDSFEKIKNLAFPLAVRSSFLGEDSDQNSFAGLFESVYEECLYYELIQ